MKPLFLHCGAEEAKRDVLDTFTTPAATDTWQPISHRHLVDQIETSLAQNNMRIVKERFGVTQNGDRMFGVLNIQNCHTGASDYDFVVGVRNSHDKKFPAGLCVGSNVFVCDNLAFSSEIVVARKHTKKILMDLPLLVNNAVGQLGLKWNEQAKRIDVYKETELSNTEAHDLIMNAFRAGACTTQQIGKIVKEYDNPRHPEFRGKTAWNLFNAFTEIGKDGGLTAMAKRTMNLHAVFDAHTGLLVNDAK